MSLNITLRLDRFDAAELRVHGCELTDEISGLFELSLQVSSPEPALDLRDLLGRAAAVELGDETFLREMTGIVRSARQLSSEPAGDSVYELIVAPPLWWTTQRRDHRIFQDLSAPEIASAVLARYGTIKAPATRLRAAHRAREYCVQYGETDFEFVARILAEAGIAWYFDHGPDKASAWTLCDDTTVPRDAVPSVRFAPRSGAGQHTTAPHVLGVLVSDDIVPSRAVVRDFDFEKPTFVLTGASSAEEPRRAAEDPLERYDYAVGRFSTEADGALLARQLLEEARALRRGLRCTASFAMPAGSYLAITDHPRHDVNRALLVVSSRARIALSSSGEPVRTSELICIPADTPYRPSRRDKPRVHGTQTAFVVGEPGEEIHADPHGRVKVAFRWDRRDMTSGSPTRYVRVAHGWAGAGLGLVALPRVGDEVVIAYLDGDPDEPLIVGRVHNATSPGPLKLPEEKTKSIWKSRSSPGGDGYNAIAMDDKAGAETLDIRAQRDMAVGAGRHAKTTVAVDASTAVGGDQSTSIGGQQTLSVGRDQTIGVTGDRAITAANQRTSAGEISASGATSITDEAPLIGLNGTSVTTVRAGAMLFLSAGSFAALQSGGGVRIDAPGVIVHGGAVAVAGDTDVNLHAPKITVTGGEICVLGGTVTIGGSTEVNVTGGTVKVTGEAGVEIAGGTIKIG